MQARDSAQQAVAREDPVVRSLEQSADTERQAVAREDLAVHARESSQRAVAREDPVVKSLEQSATLSNEPWQERTWQCKQVSHHSE